MKKTLTLIAALALFAAGAAAQQEVHDARNGMLDLIWDSDNEEIVELWVAFRIEENAARPAAGWLLGEEIPLLSTDPPVASVARNEVLDIITEAEDADVVALWTAFENAEQAGLGLVTVRAEGQGQRELLRPPSGDAHRSSWPLPELHNPDQGARQGIVPPVAGEVLGRQEGREAPDPEADGSEVHV